jgi:5-formyltetrahydrofolate cyclo-ligase
MRSADGGSENVKAQYRARFRRDRELTFTPQSWIHILKTPEVASAQSIATYLSYGHEPQTIDLNQALLAQGKRLFLPRMLEDKSLEWVEWDGSSERLKKAKRSNLREPMGSATHDIEEISVVIVPSLHITHEGFRLGQGGGSYDRALPDLSAWKVGLVYSGEFTSEEVPIEPHDIRLDAVATPDLLIRFSNL